MKLVGLTQYKYAIVDDEDYHRLIKRNWSYAGGYAVTKIRTEEGYTTLAMHKMLMNPQKGFDVDHINHNKLDNRKCNLRICTRSQNKQNQAKQKNNKSGFKGVSWHNKLNKWQALIMVDRHLRHLGYFDEIEDAARAYNLAAKQYHGDYSVLNTVPLKTSALYS